MQVDLFVPIGQLYRHFDSAGRLLYVGQSLHAVARLAQHRKSKWYSQIARVDVEAFPSKEEAEIAERKAIREENPLYNVVGKDRPKVVRPKMRQARAKPMAVRPSRPQAGSAISNAERQAKWRAANRDLHRQRSRESMRKLRSKAEAN